MSPHADGAVLRNLPGSDRMVGGPLLCMFHELSPALHIGGWTCGSLHMHVAYEKAVAYARVDCQAVFEATEHVRASPDAAAVLIDGRHAPGHPLPGVFTVTLPAYRIDFRAYKGTATQHHMWVHVYRLE